MLAAWWIANLLQAGFTELANDEAYYHMFSKSLAWGYFDHPPMTALLVWLGGFCSGELGVRLFFTLLQLVYLFVLWQIIKPEKATRRDVNLFVLISAAMPILQLYGFIAVPDSPLMLLTALFLWAYKEFTKSNSWLSAILISIAVAALAYSKYQGALVVIFAILSNIKIMKNPKFWVACAGVVILILPHLWWQWDHDWVSFRYHLMGRNRDFQLSFLTEYILNIIAVFNPLLFPLIAIAWWKSRAKNLAIRAMSCIAAGFIFFFLLSTFKGYAQPQWVIPAVFGVIALLFNYVRENEKLRRYTVRVSVVTIILVCLLRIEMIFNPLGLRFEIFNNKSSFGLVADMADGRPVIYEGSYTNAAKYTFYTGGEAFAQPTVDYRTSQYEFMDSDTQWAGESVIIETTRKEAQNAKVIQLPNGRDFRYIECLNFIPVRKIDISSTSLPEIVSIGDTLHFELTISNPYPYDYNIDADSTKVSMAWARKGEPTVMINLDGVRGLLPAHGELKIKDKIVINGLKSDKKYRVGFTIANLPVVTWFNSPVEEIKVKKQ